jgi:hypothetical protein
MRLLIGAGINAQLCKPENNHGDSYMLAALKSGNLKAVGILGEAGFEDAHPPMIWHGAYLNFLRHDGEDW